MEHVTFLKFSTRSPFCSHLFYTGTARITERAAGSQMQRLASHTAANKWDGQVQLKGIDRSKGGPWNNADSKYYLSVIETSCARTGVAPLSTPTVTESRNEASD
jgi:hypothetical protein